MDLLDGPEPEALSALPLAADLVARMVPWTRWWWVPDHTASATGMAWGAPDIAVVATAGLTPPELVSLSLHEAWHLAEVWLHGDLLRVLDSCLANGPDWGSDYLNTPQERRARAFAAWATYVLEGGRMVAGRDGPPEVELFWKLFSGRVGQEVLAKGTPPRPSLVARLLGRGTQ